MPDYYLSGITHDSPITQEKLRYFVDSVELSSKALGEPLFKDNTNPRQFCNLIYKLLINPVGDDKRRHIKHLYHNYSKHLTPPLCLPIPHFNQELQKADTAILAYCRKQLDEAGLKVELEAVTTLLDKEFFENTIEQLEKIILCTEPLSEHNHEEALDYCSNVLVTEYYSIGFRGLEVAKIFNLAVGQYSEVIDQLDESTLKSIPVPPAIYSQRTGDIEEYKSAVKDYYKESRLDKQLKNLFYIYNVNNRPRTFILKVNNMSIATGEDFIYDGITFSNSFMEKYIFDWTLDEYKTFLKPSHTWLFAEVVVTRGTKDSALDEALYKLKQGVDYLYFHLSMDYDISNRSLKPEVDLTQYIMKDEVENVIATRFSRRVKAMTVDYLKEGVKLEKFKDHASAQHYIQVRKIYYGAFNSENTAIAANEFWRYCESLFENGKSPEVIERVLDVILKKYPHHIYYAGLKLGMHLGINYRHSNFCNWSGVNSAELNQFLQNLGLERSNLEKMVDWFKHPLFIRVANNALKMNPANLKIELDNHYFKLLKNCNIQRNLLQHSNVIITELNALTESQLPYLMNCVDFIVTQELLNNPAIDKLESIFPPLTILDPQRLPNPF